MSPMATTMMKPLDAFHAELSGNMIGSWGFVDAIPDRGALERQFHRVAARFPRMRCCLKRRPRAHWVPVEEFDARSHIVWVRRGDIRCERDLLNVVAEWVTRPLDPLCPLWRIVVITNVLEGGPAADDTPITGILLVIHHAVADGLRVLEIARTCALAEKRGDSDADPQAGASFSDAKKLSAGESRMGGRRVNKANRISQFPPPSMTTRIGWALGTAGTALFPIRGRSVLTGDTSSRRHIEVMDVSLRRLRQIRRRHAASWPGVLLALLGGGIRRYHEARGMASARSCRTIVPWARGATPGGIEDLGNDYSPRCARLSLRDRSFSERLQEIESRLGGFGPGRFGAFSFHLQMKIYSVLPRPLKLAIYKLWTRTSHCMCTILPGPRRSLVVGDVEVERLYALVPLMESHGVSFLMMSYRRHLTVTALTDPGIIPDSRQLLDCFREELQGAC